jgi:exodeoxyribonuclease VIII
VADLKTTEDASPAAFARSVATYRYHVQAAFYLDGLRACDAQIDAFAFVAVEKTPPYLVAVYSADEICLARGREEYRADLLTFAECLRTDCWPGYPPFVQPLSLPAWALK